MPKAVGALIPETEEDISIRVYAQHDVLHGCVVDEGSFRVDKEDIRDPNLLNQSVIKGHAFVCSASKGESLILPIVPEIKCHRKVLGTEKGASENQCFHHHFSLMNFLRATVFIVVSYRLR